MAERLDLADVTHWFEPGRPVLRDVSLSLHADGGSTSISAPSGAGKSTLLAVLGGLVRPRRGTVAVVGGGGHDPRAVTAWVFQTTNLLPRRTAAENVAVVALRAGAPRRRALERARACLHRVGLADVADRPGRLLSGGEVQRVAIARALASRAPFLLADEPTGQLDPATARAVADVLFDDSTARSAHLVLVTHDPALAARCHRQLRLVDSRLRAAAP